MKKPRLASQARARLDERFQTIGPALHDSKPLRGWVRAIREALGLSTAQLAKRLGIKQPSVVAIEESESKGTIELATLQRAAEALGCKVVYALVPNKPLEQTMRERARHYVNHHLNPVEHSMLLEDQQVNRQDIESRVDNVLREINPRKLWD